jgi:hypothetical protein
MVLLFGGIMPALGAATAPLASVTNHIPMVGNFITLMVKDIGIGAGYVSTFGMKTLGIVLNPPLLLNLIIKPITNMINRARNWFRSNSGEAGYKPAVVRSISLSSSGSGNYRSDEGNSGPFAGGVSVTSLNQQNETNEGTHQQTWVRDRKEGGVGEKLGHHGSFPAVSEPLVLNNNVVDLNKSPNINL